MKMHKIKTAMVTFIQMKRFSLINKEEMMDYCNGKKDQKDSVNDALESFYQGIRLGKELKKLCRTYFLPKLPEEEIELVEKNDPFFFQTLYDDFSFRRFFKLNKGFEYVKGICMRETIEMGNGINYYYFE